MNFIKTKKQFFVVWLIMVVGMSLALCYFTNDYEVSREVRDGNGKGDWHYEYTYYSFPEATLNNLKENWWEFIAIGVIVFVTLIRFIVDSEWDEAFKDRYGEGMTYWDRKNIDETLGIDRFNPNKKRR